MLREEILEPTANVIEPTEDEVTVASLVKMLESERTAHEHTRKVCDRFVDDYEYEKRYRQQDKQQYEHDLNEMRDTKNEYRELWQEANKRPSWGIMVALLVIMFWIGLAIGSVLVTNGL
jgi:predicted AlkP superfamily phosphohydrolase/phosphomutase